MGRSTGWASFSGFSEAKDLEALAQWALDKIPDIHVLVFIVGALLSVKVSFLVYLSRATLMGP